MSKISPPLSHYKLPPNTPSSPPRSRASKSHGQGFWTTTYSSRPEAWGENYVSSLQDYKSFSFGSPELKSAEDSLDARFRIVGREGDETSSSSEDEKRDHEPSDVNITPRASVVSLHVEVEISSHDNANLLSSSSFSDIQLPLQSDHLSTLPTQASKTRSDTRTSSDPRSHPSQRRTDPARPHDITHSNQRLLASPSALSPSLTRHRAEDSQAIQSSLHVTHVGADRSALPVLQDARPIELNPAIEAAADELQFIRGTGTAADHRHQDFGLRRPDQERLIHHSELRSQFVKEGGSPTSTDTSSIYIPDDDHHHPDELDHDTYEHSDSGDTYSYVSSDYIEDDRDVGASGFAYVDSVYSDGSYAFSYSDTPVPASASGYDAGSSFRSSSDLGSYAPSFAPSSYAASEYPSNIYSYRAEEPYPDREGVRFDFGQRDGDRQSFDSSLSMQSEQSGTSALSDSGGSGMHLSISSVRYDAEDGSLGNEAGVYSNPIGLSGDPGTVAEDPKIDQPTGQSADEGDWRRLLGPYPSSTSKSSPTPESLSFASSQAEISTSQTSPKSIPRHIHTRSSPSSLPLAEGDALADFDISYITSGLALNANAVSDAEGVGTLELDFVRKMSGGGGDGLIPSKDAQNATLKRGRARAATTTAAHPTRGLSGPGGVRGMMRTTSAQGFLSSRSPPNAPTLYRGGAGSVSAREPPVAPVIDPGVADSVSSSGPFPTIVSPLPDATNTRAQPLDPVPNIDLTAVMVQERNSTYGVPTSAPMLAPGSPRSPSSPSPPLVSANSAHTVRRSKSILSGFGSLGLDIGGIRSKKPSLTMTTTVTPYTSPDRDNAAKAGSPTSPTSPLSARTVGPTITPISAAQKEAKIDETARTVNDVELQKMHATISDLHSTSDPNTAHPVASPDSAPSSIPSLSVLTSSPAPDAVPATPSIAFPPIARAPSVVSLRSSNSFSYDDSFAKGLMAWGGSDYKDMRKEWVIRRERAKLEDDKTCGEGSSTGGKENKNGEKGMIVGTEEIWENFLLGRFNVSREEVYSHGTRGSKDPTADVLRDGGREGKANNDKGKGKAKSSGTEDMEVFGFRVPVGKPAQQRLVIKRFRDDNINHAIPQMGTGAVAVKGNPTRGSSSVASPMKPQIQTIPEDSATSDLSKASDEASTAHQNQAHPRTSGDVSRSRRQQFDTQHPAVLIHKHSRVAAFSLSRHHKDRGGLSSHINVIGSSKHMSPTSTTTSASSTSLSSRLPVVMLAQREVQEAFTHTETTKRLVLDQHEAVMAAFAPGYGHSPKRVKGKDKDHREVKSNAETDRDQKESGQRKHSNFPSSGTSRAHSRGQIKSDGGIELGVADIGGLGLVKAPATSAGLDSLGTKSAPVYKTSHRKAETLRIQERDDAEIDNEDADAGLGGSPGGRMRAWSHSRENYKQAYGTLERPPAKGAAWSGATIPSEQSASSKSSSILKRLLPWDTSSASGSSKSTSSSSATSSISTRETTPTTSMSSDVTSSYVPPWVTLTSREHQEAQRKVLGSLEHSFENVGLLPSKDKKKRSRKSSLPSGGGITPRNPQVKNDVLARIPSGAFFMLLPLWPGETDMISQRLFPFEPPFIPLEDRRFLLVFYKALPADHPNKARTGPANDPRNILLSGFRAIALPVSYADLQGTGVRVPEGGLSVTGPLEDAFKHMPRSVVPRQRHSPTHEDDVFTQPSIIGSCYSREAGVEFDPEALIELELCTVLGDERKSIPPGMVAEQFDSEQSTVSAQLTPIGVAAMEMVFCGGLALTSFGAMQS